MTDSEFEELAKQNIAVFQRWFDAANTNDVEARRELYHQDIVHELPWTLDPFPKVIQGFDNVMAFSESVRNFGSAPKFYDISIHAFLDDPNELYAEYKSNWDLASGRPYSNDYIARARIEDGKIIMFREWPDPLRLLEALGGSVNLPDDGLPKIVHAADD
jgi:ketosteroid isomerase-like protein